MKKISDVDTCDDSQWEMQLRSVIDGVLLNLRKLKLSMGYKETVGGAPLRYDKEQIAAATKICKAHFPG